MKKLFIISVFVFGFSLQAQQVQTRRHKMSCAQLCKSAIVGLFGIQSALGDGGGPAGMALWRSYHQTPKNERCVQVKGYDMANRKVWVKTQCFERADIVRLEVEFAPSGSCDPEFEWC